MAGLLNNLSQDDVQEVPGLARLPIIGHLFQQQGRNGRSRTELLVLITPQLIRPLNPDEVPPCPQLSAVFSREAAISAIRFRAAVEPRMVRRFRRLDARSSMRMYSGNSIEGRCDSRNVCRLARPSGREDMLRMLGMEVSRATIDGAIAKPRGMSSH